MISRTEASDNLGREVIYRPREGYEERLDEFLGKHRVKVSIREYGGLLGSLRKAFGAEATPTRDVLALAHHRFYCVSPQPCEDVDDTDRAFADFAMQLLGGEES